MVLTSPPESAYQVTISLTMSLAAARQVIWQGRGPREPIGQLLDSKQIGYRDLAWAVDGAYKPEVPEAAWRIEVVARRLAEPTRWQFALINIRQRPYR